VVKIVLLRMRDKFNEENRTVTVPCPDSECDEMHDVSTTDKPEHLVNSCDGCNKKIWLQWDLNPGYFNIYSGDGGGNDYSQRYRRTIEDNVRFWSPL